jgi:hypothetical protein
VTKRINHKEKIMGRFKDIAIEMAYRADQDCPNDDELRVLMENFKPTPEELQAELEELQAHATSLPAICVQPEVKVYLLMKNGFPQRSYTDRALAFYECWICTEGDMHAETPDDYYVVEIMHDVSTFEE